MAEQSAHQSCVTKMNLGTEGPQSKRKALGVFEMEKG